MKKFQVDLQFSKINADKLFSCMVVLIVANMPCNEKRFTEIEMLIENICFYKGDEDGKILNSDIKKMMQ